MFQYNIGPIDYAQKSIIESLESSKSVPTDIFLLRQEDCSKLVEKYKNIIVSDNAYIGDIFLANTIPIMDMYLGPIDAHQYKARVIIFPNMVEKLSNYVLNQDGNGNKCCNIEVGMIIWTINPGFNIAIDMMFDIEKMQIIADLRPVPFGSNVQKDLSDEQRKVWTDAFFTYMHLWYAIQLSLLHPQVKMCFSHPQRQRIKKEVYAQKKVPKEYINIRKHILDASAFEEALHTDVGHKKYTCLCWWVQGHFRTQNGKRTFVKGYWKGPLRKTKQVEKVRLRGINV